MSVTNVAISSAINSGAEEPAAIKVAPATAGGNSHAATMHAMATAKYCSATWAMPAKHQQTPTKYKGMAHGDLMPAGSAQLFLQAVVDSPRRAWWSRSSLSSSVSSSSLARRRPRRLPGATAPWNSGDSAAAATSRSNHLRCRMLLAPEPAPPLRKQLV